MEKIMQFFNDEKLLKDIRSGIALTLALGLGMLYFGFADNVTLEALLNFSMGALAIISMISVWIVRVEISFRAFDDELDQNVELKKDVGLMKIEQNKIIDYDSAIDYIKKYNVKQQDFANKVLTDNAIKRLENKIIQRKILGKSYDKIQAKINKLERVPLIDKSYKPVTLKQIKGYGKSNKSEFSGITRFVYNPRTDGNKKSLLIAPLKGFGIGGAGSIPFIVTASAKTIFIYYSILILSIGLTIISRYLKVRKNTKVKYHMIVKNRTLFIQDMLKHKVVKQTLLIDTKEKD